MKLCSDCRFFVPETQLREDYPGEFGRCSRRNNKMNPATGLGELQQLRFTAVIRRTTFPTDWFMSVCGRRGRFWKAKP